MDGDFEIAGNCVDVVAGTIAPRRIRVQGGRIAAVEPVDAAGPFVLPGFVDAHVHVESSMLSPAEFARLAACHGTVAAVSDPHEIANVCGRQGIEWMLASARGTDFHFGFGAPSCVPATRFETSGAVLDGPDVEALLDLPEISYLSEVMNFPGVIAGRPEVLGKIAAAKVRNLPVDGHAPGLRGEELTRYLAAGITTDHETTTLEEGRERIAAGCQVLIREGSAAHNFDALWPLIRESPDACMLCSDDKHPDELLAGHINQLVVRAIEAGCPLMDVLRVACLNPVQHYRLPTGLLQLGDPADFQVVRDLESFAHLRTYLKGRCVAQDGQPLVAHHPAPLINQFVAQPLLPRALEVPAESSSMHLIEVEDGQLITGRSVVAPRVEDGLAIADVEHDVLKLVVVNRYVDAPPAVAFVRGMGLVRGALASSVAHDSHNILAVGTADDVLAQAIAAVMECQGGLAIASDGEVDVLPLPIAGLMSPDAGEQVAARYLALDARAKGLGSGLRAPWMMLSFLALPVIPRLKLTDRGLFDVEAFAPLPLFL